MSEYCLHGTTSHALEFLPAPLMTIVPQFIVLVAGAAKPRKLAASRVDSRKRSAEAAKRLAEPSTAQASVSLSRVLMCLFWFVVCVARAVLKIARIHSHTAPRKNPHIFF